MEKKKIKKIKEMFSKNQLCEKIEKEIDQCTKKIVKDYGEVILKLGKE